MGREWCVRVLVSQIVRRGKAKGRGDLRGGDVLGEVVLRVVHATREVHVLAPLHGKRVEVCVALQRTEALTRTECIGQVEVVC